MSAWRIAAGAMAVGLAAGCGAGGAGKAGEAAARPTVVLTFASAISGGQPDVLETFAQEVQRRTHGALRIDFKASYRAQDVRYEEHTIADVRSGRVDMAWVGARAWDSVGIHDFDALIAPFLVDSYRIEDAVFRAGIADEMLPSITRAGVVPVGILPGPLRLLLAVDRPVRRPADLRGRVIGVAGYLAAQTLTALGARPRPVYAQTPLTGLDGLELQASGIDGMLYDREASSLVTNLALWPRPLVLFTSQRVARELAPSERAALAAAAAVAARKGISIARRDERSGAANLCRRHQLELLAATPAELQAFRNAVDPVYRHLRSDTVTRRYLRRIETLARGLPPEAPYRCVATTVSFGHAVSPLDGTWEMRVSQEYLARHHPSYLPPPTRQDILLDSGSYRYVFRRGRVDYEHDAPLIHSHSTGVFRVKGNTIEIVYTAGHDAGNPILRFRWNLYRGALTFRPIGRVPAETTLAPWHRAHR